ncbi:transposase [Mesorhizobium sp.]|uniref:transposase n=1 Tax=Mesorhizobium sp. TaxID=1871066 RepID=UPI0025875052|nr:transposase [Mesorhizobium sp.]
MQIHRNHPVCRLLASIPGVGPTTATAFAATIPNPLRARIRICRVARWAPCS